MKKRTPYDINRFKYLPLHKPFFGPEYRKLFRTWREILDWYEEDIMCGDLPYWYHERTNIGNLALAAYQLSGFPLQEFSCVKGRGAVRSEGRADLFVTLPRKLLSKGKRTGSAPSELNIESKQMWCSLRFGHQAERAITRKLGKVIHDCRAIKDPYWKVKLRVGMLFVLPYKQKIIGSRHQVLKEEVHRFTARIEKLAMGLDAGFVAVHLSHMAASRKIYDANRTYGWCPGIIIMGKCV